MKYSYTICSGWWCSDDFREYTFGDESIRGKDFHQLWYNSVTKFTTPNKIFICNNNAPILPNYHNMIEFTSLNVNAGHATKLLNNQKYCGWTSSVLLGLSYTELSDSDYFVYVEQDVLLYGKNIVECSIDKMKKNKTNVIFGRPRSSPQPLEVSFFIVRKSYINKLASRYKSINYDDSKVSPEVKLALSIIGAHKLPLFMTRNSYFQYMLKRLMNKKYFHDFGYGRHKPIDFNDDYLYFQHGDVDELKYYKEKTGCKL